LDARRQRIIISESQVNLLKWACLFMQAICATIAVTANSVWVEGYPSRRLLSYWRLGSRLDVSRTDIGGRSMKSAFL
jgi:hypothetical protein